jgi:signal transduction histidine kinase/DNA-binding response OmpR family regulator/ligand-binding sensor domain-containing protein
MKPVAILFFSLLAPLLLWSQQSSTVTLLSVNDGLSQGMIYHIQQSRDGFLWIATKDGLNRFDGYRFETYSPDPFNPYAISSSEVYHLFEDSRGRIWLKLPGGIDLYDPVGGRFYHLPDTLFRGALRGVDGFSFAELPDGSIFFTDAEQIWRIREPEEALRKARQKDSAFPVWSVSKVQAPPPGPGALHYSLQVTATGELLCASGNGLLRYNQATGQMAPEAFRGLSTRILGADLNGSIWVETEQADLWAWESPASDPRKLGRARAFDFSYFDEKGYLWTLHEKKLEKWRPEEYARGGKPEFTWASKEPVVQSHYFAFQCMWVDRSGIAWMGTTGFGIMKVNMEKPKFQSYQQGISHRYLAEDPQGNLISGVVPGVIFPSFDFDQVLPNPFLTDLPEKWPPFLPAFDQAGSCWGLPEPQVLLRIDARSGTVQSYEWEDAGTSRMKFCRDGTLLQVSEDGLSRFYPGNGAIRHFPFDSPQQLAPDSYFMLDFLEDEQGVIWITGFEGLIKATPEKDQYRYEYFRTEASDPASLSYNTVLSVAEDPLEPGRYLWVGTKGGGLNRLDRQSGQFKHYRKNEGLPDQVIYGILTDDQGHLWMSTNQGLCRFHVREETVKNFTHADGLAGNEFNSSSYLKMRDGRLVFGGVSGLTIFHPDSLNYNEHRPQTHIVGIQVNNKNALRVLPAGGDAPLSLAHDENLLTFEFAALEFTHSAKNRYRYQLLRHRALGGNKGEKWVDLGTRNSIQFANLSPGRYTFSVLGSNNDPDGHLGWGEQPAVLEFTIHPPWWATWWAYLAYILLTAWAVGLVYRIQFRQRLQMQEAFRLKELDQFKNRFFVNITHEFRTPLTVILGLSKQLKTSKTPLSARESKHKVDLIQRNGENLLRLINQLLDLAKLESGNLKLNYIQGDVVPYLRYVAESLHSLAAVRGVSLQIDYPDDSIVMDYDPERLQQIVHNLLSNAIKFTPADGQVVLQAKVEKRVEQPSSQLLLLVRDTGVGIAPENLPHIFDRFHQATHLEKAFTGGTGIGLALTRELVHAMGGAIKVSSQVGKGTAFRVHLPIRQLAAPAQALPPEPPNISTDTSASPSSEKGQRQLPQLLIIEDNPDVVQYLASCLEASFVLHFAYNGADGINLAYEEIPDLIISDVMMPEKDGFEVCAALKEDERTSHIPIVLLTARAGVEDRIAGLRRGADAYLAKPFHEEELLITLNNLLTLRQKLQAKYAAFSDMPPQNTKEETEGAFLQKIHALVLEHLSDSNFSVEDLCRMIAMSQPQLHRKLTALTGKNATLFVRSIRLARGKELLQKENMTVSEVAYAVGFTDPKYFSRVFSNEFGLPPSKI